MPNQRIADLLAERLPTGLEHPGDPEQNRPAFTVPLPALRSTGLPPEMAEQFAKEAGLPSSDAPLLLATAIVNTIETAGDSTIIGNTELAELRAAAAEASTGARIIRVHCRCDPTRRKPLFDITVTNRDYATIPGNLLIPALAAMNPNCPHEEQP